MGKTIGMEGFVSLFHNELECLKLEQLNKRISNLDGMYVMSIVNITRFIIFVSSLKFWLISVLQYRP